MRVLYTGSKVAEPPNNELAARNCPLKGEKRISLQPSISLQQLINKHLAEAGVAYQPNLTVNYLNTQIAMVEAGEGIAIIPSYGHLACRNRSIVISRLVNPVVHLDTYQI